MIRAESFIWASAAMAGQVVHMLTDGFGNKPDVRSVHCLLILAELHHRMRGLHAEDPGGNCSIKNVMDVFPRLLGHMHKSALGDQTICEKMHSRG